ncbi:MAG TPA: hypothetical protein VM677_27890 [Actinokineospora sp.]|jgi:hypothetical protein|nr:hypothetical protein [Actinokineospora sp.]
MYVYACQEEPDDTVAVSAIGVGVLVVIKSGDSGQGAELEMRPSEAREAAAEIRELIVDPEGREAGTFGPLFVAEGSEDHTVYVAENPADGARYSVLLSHADAEGLATSLTRAADDCDMLRLGGDLAPSATPLTPEQAERAAAVRIAAQALGGRGHRYVSEVADYILTGSVLS